MKYQRIVLSSLVAAMVTLGGWIFWQQVSFAELSGENDGHVCPSGMAVTSPFSGSTVGGIVTLEAKMPSNINVQQITFIGKNSQTYNAQRFDPYWRASFDSRSPDAGGNGEYKVFARITANAGTLSSNSFDCDTTPISFNVQNSTAAVQPVSTLEVVPSTTQWKGPTNTPFEVVMKATLVSGAVRTDITKEAAYDWSTTRGVLSPQGSLAKVNSGPESGDGTISVKVRYGGQVRQADISLHIQPHTAAESYPSVSNSGTATASINPTTPKTLEEAQNTGLFATAQNRSGQGDAELERCLENVFGQGEYQRRVQQQTRLKYEELAKTEQCFVRRNSVLPANLAPVEPEKVSQLTVKSLLKVESMKTVTQNGKQVIQMQGVAEPNKTVVLYVFSEPLVLVAKADTNGKWSYALEDPMQPGKHEVYVTVEGDNAQAPVRSDGFGFAIATAPKTKLNPLGLSFALQQTDKLTVFYGLYIATAALIVILALLLSMWYIKRRRKATVTADSASTTPSPGSATVTPDITAPTSPEIAPPRIATPVPPVASFVPEKTSSVNTISSAPPVPGQPPTVNSELPKPPQPPKGA